MEVKCVKCEECGLLMKGRVNGSHLYRKHKMTIAEYVKKHPSADLGEHVMINPKCECKICNVELENASTLSRHVKFHHSITPEEYYKKFLMKENEDICKCGCGKKTTFININKGYYSALSGHLVGDVWNKGHTKYTHEGVMKISTNRTPWNLGLTKEDPRVREMVENMNSPEFKIKKIENTKESLLKKYGTDNIFKLKETQEKIKKTNLEKYGTENPNKNKKILEKARRTKKERYGDVNYCNPKKIRQTFLKKYGAITPMHIPEIADRIKSRSVLFREYILPSGKSIRIQGYEDRGIKLLLSRYQENEISTGRKNMPKIMYSLDGEFFSRRYYPDFYIKKDNLVVEIKSSYTNTLDPHKIKAKEEATRKLGYNYNKIVFDNKGNYTIFGYDNKIIENFTYAK